MVKKKLQFTLIELLTVISICSLLMALLLPALGKARNKAESIDCVSRLRQTMLFNTMYSLDYRNMLLAEVWAATTRNQDGAAWTSGTHYMTSKNYGLNYGPRDVAFCPNREPGMFGVSLETIDDEIYCHQYGTAFQENIRDAIWRKLGFGSGLMVHGQKHYCWAILRIKKSSDFITITDTAITAPPFKSFFCFYPLSGTDSGYSLATYHDGRNNAAFLDGHVESNLPEALRDRISSEEHYIRGYVSDSGELVNWTDD